MRRATIAMVIAAMCAVIVGAGATRGALAADDRAKLAGNWPGDSICLDRQSACHEEKVVYRIALYPSDTTRVKVQGDKIVNGRAVTMGVGDYNWDEKKNELTHEDQFGAWKIVVKGDTMDGMMTSPAGTAFRHLTLKKDG
jgi:hypothetical protein